MKELSIEEKATRYDEAIERAIAWRKKYVNSTISEDGTMVQDFDNIFPELRESDDERIRKAISDILLIDSDEMREILDSNNVLIQDIDVWLEKQGKYAENKEFLASEKRDFGYFNETTDKVEPKFHEGEWIISDTVNKDYHICKITGIKDGNYTIESIYGYKGYNQFDVFDNVYRLWTIQDAKDGDVLAYSDNRNNVYLCIYKEYKNERVYDYCTLDKESFWEHSNWNYLSSFNYTPTTKEQRDTLEKAMADAGYTFDFEKKELRKIEHKPTDKVESKFHEGEWCIDNKDGTIFQIVKVLDNTYTYKTNKGEEYSCTHYSLENDARLWTITDAKDGEVLVDEDNNISIYKEIEGICWHSYIYLGCNNRLYGFSIGGSHMQNNTKPATKEQYDLLFQKLKEVGYEWMLVRKIENEIQIPFGDKDSELQEATYYIPKGFYAEIDDDKVIIRKGEKPAAWSEEDEYYRNIILYILNNECVGKTDKENAINWLKSLKSHNEC